MANIGAKIWLKILPNIDGCSTDKKLILCWELGTSSMFCRVILHPLGNVPLDPCVRCKGIAIITNCADICFETHRPTELQLTISIGIIINLKFTSSFYEGLGIIEKIVQIISKREVYYSS